jgi:hypothetical protein
MVAAVAVPPGALLQSGTPPSALVPGTTAAVDTKVDVLRWYTVPGTRDAAFDWLNAHSPGGFSFGEYQKVGGSGPTDSYPRILSLGSDTPSRQPPGDTQVTVLNDRGHADVRVSVEVIWSPPKTAIETIPDTVTTGMLHYQRPGGNGGGAAIDKQVRLTSADVDQLRRLLNPLRPVPPGMSSCPPAPDLATLTFLYDGRQVVFTVDTGGCGFITVTADGQEQPYMRGGYHLAGPIRVMAGLPAKAPTY